MEFESENWYITSERGQGDLCYAWNGEIWGYIYDFMALKLKGAPKGSPGGKGLKRRLVYGCVRSVQRPRNFILFSPPLNR